MADPTTDFMQSLARTVDALLTSASGQRLGFALLVFDLDGQEGSRTNYVGNCDRKDMLAALKEVVARWEGQPQQRGRA